jgi:hypothetical protein
MLNFDQRKPLATKPNVREKASFLSENILPMQESGQLHFIKDLKDFLEKSELGFELLMDIPKNK